MEYIIKNINNYNTNTINNFYTNIPSIKKEKINKYKNVERKNVSIIGELLLKELLKKRNISYNKINYSYNKYGKPYLNNDIYCNISHSYEYVIATISNKEIGIDIEKIRETPLNVINQFATDKEKEYILSSENNIEKRIFEIYTLKESYFKMLGTYLNHILDVEFIIDNDKVYCSDNTVQVGFIKDIEGYIISYCEKK